MAKRLLRQKTTGRLYVYTDALAARDDMVDHVGKNPGRTAASASKPADGGNQNPEANQNDGGNQGDEGNQTIVGEDQIIVDDQVINIDHASKAVLEAYAERHFGVNLDRRKKVADLQDAVRALIAENGHPDIPEE